MKELDRARKGRRKEGGREQGKRGEERQKAELLEADRNASLTRLRLGVEHGKVS